MERPDVAEDVLALLGRVMGWEGSMALYFAGCRVPETAHRRPRRSANMLAAQGSRDLAATSLVVDLGSLHPHPEAARKWRAPEKV